jgi:hypothetical protein
MNPPAVDLETLRRLPLAERLLLVEDLWDSIAVDTPVRGNRIVSVPHGATARRNPIFPC